MTCYEISPTWKTLLKKITLMTEINCCNAAKEELWFSVPKKFVDAHINDHEFLEVFNKKL